jgi:cyclophilin family peptidyl-prolyl cis-trans isomerase
MRSALVAVAVLALSVAGCGREHSTSQSGAGCESVEAPDPREAETPSPPTHGLDPAKAYSVAVETTCGTFVVALNTKLAPKTAASLVTLARGGYFDDTVFHRIVPGFVIQGGDPTQTGSGGPGYSTVDTPPADARYTRGTMAMAKTQTEPPGTSGSQFFVVTGTDAGLPPDYAIAGKVTSGLDVVERIGKLGDASENPTQPVVVRHVTVSESS